MGVNIALPVGPIQGTHNIIPTQIFLNSLYGFTIGIFKIIHKFLVACNTIQFKHNLNIKILVIKLGHWCHL